MSTQPNHMDERTVDSLCTAYRAAVEDPSYDATDQAMLRLSARRPPGSWIRPTVYIAAALLATALGFVMIFGITAPDRQMQRTGPFGTITRHFLDRGGHAAVSLPRTLVPHDVSQSAESLRHSVQPGPNEPGCAAEPCGHISTQIASGTPPKISRFLANDLKDAQIAMKAGDYDEEIAALQKAFAAKGQRSAFDDFIINSWLGTAYVNQKNYAQGVPALAAAAQSQYASPAQRSGMLGAVVGIYSRLHEYDKAIEAAKIAIKIGVANPTLYVTMAVDEDESGRHKEAAQTIQQIIDREPKPEEKYLMFQWNAYTKANDRADAARVADEICFYYRRPDYCRAH